MAKITDKLISKYGSDRLLHLTVSACIVALVSPLGLTEMLTATIVTLAVGYYKEAMLDETFDPKDILFSAIGCASVLVFNLIIKIIQQL